MFIRDLRLNAEIGVKIQNFPENIENEIADLVHPFFIEVPTIVNGLSISGISGETKFDKHLNTYYIDINRNKELILNDILAALRLYFKHYALCEGYLNVHAACIEYRGKGILIVADRNNGKTTSLLRLLSLNKYRYVANDQVMINPLNNTTLGYPAYVGIRSGSIDKPISEEYIFGYIEDPFQKEKKPLLHYNDLSKLIGFEVTSWTEASLVIYYSKSLEKAHLSITDSFNGTVADLPQLSLQYEIFGTDDCLPGAGETVQDTPQKSIKSVNVKCGIDRIKDFSKFIDMAI